MVTALVTADVTTYDTEPTAKHKNMRPVFNGLGKDEVHQYRTVHGVCTALVRWPTRLGWSPLPLTVSRSGVSDAMRRSTLIDLRSHGRTRGGF